MNPPPLAPISSGAHCPPSPTPSPQVKDQWRTRPTFPRHRLSPWQRAVTSSIDPSAGSVRSVYTGLCMPGNRCNKRAGNWPNVVWLGAHRLIWCVPQDWIQGERGWGLGLPQCTTPPPPPIPSSTMCNISFFLNAPYFTSSSVVPMELIEILNGIWSYCNP